MSELKELENYLRITQVLSPFSGLDKIDPYVLQNAADRGTRVHKICESIISGLGEFGNGEETWGYVESFKQWWATNPQVVVMEERFFDEDEKITGQVDLIIQIDEGLAIVDLKTSSRPSKTWAPQGSAYAYLARKKGYDIKKIFFLHLNKHGKAPKLIEYPINEKFFFEILNVFNHFYGVKNVK
jgi:hypothetical protein